MREQKESFGGAGASAPRVAPGIPQLLRLSQT